MENNNIISKAHLMLDELTEDDHAVLYVVDNEGNLQVANIQINDGIKLAIFNAEADKMEENTDE